MASRRKKHGKKHMSAHLIGMIVMGVLLNLAVLPCLFWLYYGDTVEAGVLDEIPYHIDESQIREQRLMVVNSQEKRTIRIPVSGEASLHQEIAARRITLSVDPGIVQDIEQLTIEADTECITSATLHRAGRELTFELTLADGLIAELTSAEDGQLITLKPMTEEEHAVLLDVRGEICAVAVAERVSELLSAEEGMSVPVYVIGNEAEPLTDAEYDAFIAQCAPDVYLRIGDGSEETGYALCNPRYFLPGLDSVVLAETVLKEVLAETGETTRGVVTAEAEDPLHTFTYPAAALVLRDLSTETAENRALYTDTVSQGIARGLAEALSE